MLRSPEAHRSHDAGRRYRPDVEAAPRAAIEPVRHLDSARPPGTAWGSPLGFADGYSFGDQAISGGIIASNRQLELSADGNDLVYTFDTQADNTGIAGLLRQLNELGIDFKDLRTEESSLEDIFVNLVSTRR